MAFANTTLRIAELDPLQIKENLKTFLRSQDRFIGYDFDGDNLNILLDILSYNTFYNAFYLNMAASEAHLDTSQLRSSTISHAKKLGYTPRSRTAPRALVDIRITPGSGESNTTNNITLSKYNRFFSNPIDGVPYNFVNLEANTAVKSNGSFLLANVTLYQGEVSSISYTMTEDNDKSMFIIPSANVYKDSIVVSIQESVSNTTTTTYTEFQDITALQANSKVYFLEESSDANGNYLLYFGDNILGQKPANGNIITVTYLETRGPDANKSNNFVSLENIDGYSANVIVLPKQAATSGSYKESIDSVRYRAPRFYETQNRIVTTKDFETILLKDYPNIQSISVWGGDEEDPPIYGKVYICINPTENYYLTIDEKERIKSHIIENRSVMTVEPVIVDPDFNYLKLVCYVDYNPDKTTRSQSELTSLVNAVVTDYSDSYLNSFTGVYRASQVTKGIDNIDDSILGSYINTFLQKRVELTLDESFNYTLKFGQKLYKGGVQAKMYSYPSITVKDSSEINREVYFEETPNSFTGIEKIEVIDAGTGYTETPTVTISGDGTGATATAKIVNGRVSSITVNTTGIDYTRATITITGNGSGASAQAVLEGRTGTLRTYYYKENGEKVIVNSAAGRLDYDNGIIYVDNLTTSGVSDNPYYSANVVTFNIKPQYDIIHNVKNQLNLIDANDPSAVVVEFTESTR